MGFEAAAHKYADKTRFELRQLEKRGVQVVGNAFSPVLLVKGVPNQDEAKGQAVFSGEDGRALRAALAKLGYAPEEWCGMACWDMSGAPLTPDVLGLAFVTLDPATIIACDDVAVASICSALLGDLFTLEEGRVTILRGVRVLTLGGFEAALASPQRKQVMWARLKQVPPLADPY